MAPGDTWCSGHQGRRGFGRGPRGVLPVQWLGRLGGWLKQLPPAASLAWRSPVLRAQGPHLGLSRHHSILPAPRDGGALLTHLPLAVPQLAQLTHAGCEIGRAAALSSSDSTKQAPKKCFLRRRQLPSPSAPDALGPRPQYGPAPPSLLPPSLLPSLLW